MIKPPSSIDSNMSCLRDACHLNWQGSSYLLNGDFPHAIDLLRRSLVVLSRRSVLPMQRNLENNLAEVSKTHVVIPELRNIPTTSNSLGGRLEGTCTEFVYRSPIVLCGGFSTGDEVPTVSAAAQYTGAVLFNLALAHHLQDLNGNSIRMEKAKDFYEMALEVLLQDQAGASSLSPTTATLMALTLNNKAACHFVMCDYSSARMSSQLLLRVIRSATPLQIGMEVVVGLEMNAVLMADERLPASHAA